MAAPVRPTSAENYELCSEFKPYNLPFIEVRRYQGKTAFAAKDFNPGDTILEEKPYLQWAEREDVGAGIDKVALLHLYNEEKRRYEINLSNEEKEQDVEKVVLKSHLPSIEFFSPCMFLDWPSLATTQDVLFKAFDLFYWPGGDEQAQAELTQESSEAGKRTTEQASTSASSTGTTASTINKEKKLEQIHKEALKVCDRICTEFLSKLFKKHYSTSSKKSFTAKNLFNLLQLIDINIHKDGEDKDSRCGIFVIGSKFSHSCASNASWSLTSAGKLKYVATRKIAKGEVFSFSYVGDGLNVCGHTVDRRAALRKLGFVCACDRCCELVDRSRGGVCKACKSHKCFVVNRSHILQFTRQTDVDDERNKVVEAALKDKLDRAYRKNAGKDEATAGAPNAEVEAADMSEKIIPDFADADFYCKGKPAAINSKTSTAPLDRYFCTDCGNFSQFLTPDQLAREQRIGAMLPTVLDSNSAGATREKKDALVQEIEAHFGIYHYSWSLAAFAWLQSVLLEVGRTDRIDLNLSQVKKRCEMLRDTTKVCFEHCWVQRLRLLGLVAHLERVLGLKALVLPAPDPLEVNVPVVTKMLRHDKFRHLDIFLWEQPSERVGLLEGEKKPPEKEQEDNFFWSLVDRRGMASEKLMCGKFQTLITGG
ncbi:unnamed protein product [Amoebophrya sp. A120]|nr:unnamed protein product [Amoebophrya sp. A120]|eukprot:GSA120T00017735001.1